MVGRDFEVVEVEKGKTTSLDCSISGTEPLEFEWYLGAELMKSAKTQFVHQTAQNRILQFLSVRTTDEGRYTCKGSNSAGDARKTYELRVLGELGINQIISVWGFQNIITQKFVDTFQDCS